MNVLIILRVRLVSKTGESIAVGAAFRISFIVSFARTS